ncbi:1,4-alpha-glucan branching protein GlgB [Shewanella surugensis]|uniref:1,4-alpha-glucan branching enzyme GlgB n=1 Tax=Shewanella surugensis TaxID=212020 RepID=A0ABT0LFY5_9GAMM|nr:1,4-alpha-glucan branching protein GlgB [Shewanella surugensis]MCL1126626.1 1,4-alpha-glucan branching protein GlgB [Shewanella surugensis]
MDKTNKAQNITYADHDFLRIYYDESSKKWPLGIHCLEEGAEQTGSLSVTVFLPEAISVDVVSLTDAQNVVTIGQINEHGLFSGVVARSNKPFLYKLIVQYPLGIEEIIDPYQFHSLVSESDVYLFSEGCQYQAEHFLGANWHEPSNISGVLFCVWAPNAQRVAIVGDFNHWDPRRHSMRKHESSGIWELFIADVEEYQHYKFEILTHTGEVLRKADPFAKQMESAPGNAGVIPSQRQYQWRDKPWLIKRAQSRWHMSAISIFEVHLASWRRKTQGDSVYLNYQDLIEQLIPYVQEMEFTHLQLMPISEYPFDASWGYQPIGMYAPSYRFGDPMGLKRFIDACHQAGISVILDWVAAHFPKDPHGLATFDGTCLFEHADPLKGEHPDWDTLIYNYDRSEVRSYLLSNACYWLREFHFDGLRLDAVSSMLYLDYSRKADQWRPNQWGGNENLEAIAFLRLLNQVVYQDFPGIVMIAEESTAWPGVTHPTTQDNRALGFGFKWNMGWMNDTLAYLKRDPIHRHFHHKEMTFSLVYCFNEQFILSLSHDEVVHGKGTLLEKIPGDDWQKFATLRSYYGFMWGHPGKKLLFMGGEFGQRQEWDHDKGLDWSLLVHFSHLGLQTWVKDLNHLYRTSGVLFENDHQISSFQWLDCDNHIDSIFVFVRYGVTDDRHLIFVVNMLPDVKYHYRIGLPKKSLYRELLNSDSEYYGGSNKGNTGFIIAHEEAYQGMAQSALITVPPLGCLVLAPMALIEDK